MLKEFKDISQPEKKYKRKWYNDEEFELIIWYEENEICGFQLCYEDHTEKKAITYTNGKYSHDKIDEGGKWNETPILLKDGRFEKERIIKEFTEKSLLVEKEEREEREYILRALEKY
ncbi:hypothetical protein [Breznakiella homolactica]|uniref:Uncharacterized protein n=1 Tax=Breznakiella homolactica TaxID=2798577 RepID=A0A7T7XR21_9SPIR|nr:hypothetical protein [Breznakiella homolactica]QQO10898.1 hypothetical protein JFL75_08270 [Breznakiella homolactica]